MHSRKPEAIFWATDLLHAACRVMTVAPQQDLFRKCGIPIAVAKGMAGRLLRQRVLPVHNQLNQSLNLQVSLWLEKTVAFLQMGGTLEIVIIEKFPEGVAQVRLGVRGIGVDVPHLNCSYLVADRIANLVTKELMPRLGREELVLRVMQRLPLDVSEEIQRGVDELTEFLIKGTYVNAVRNSNPSLNKLK